MKKLFLILAAILLFISPVYATTLAPLPHVRAQFFNATGTAPLAYGVVYFCEAGSTCPGTPKNTYTSYAGTTANANPVALSASGRANIWLNGFYKMVVKTAVGGTIIDTQDYVSAAPQQTTTTVSEWQAVDVATTYISTTSFSVPGNHTGTFTAGRRIKTTNTGGTIYGTVSSSVYAATVTTVTVTNDTGTLDAGLSATSVGILTITNSSIPVPQVLSKTANYTITAADHGKTIISASTSTAVTITIATPAVFTATTHGYAENQSVGFLSTASLPGGLTQSTPYYVIVDGLTADNFEVSATMAGAALNTSGTQSGTHTSHKQVTFTLPSATAVQSGFFVYVKNNSALPLSISGTVDGSTTLKLIQYDEIRLSSNGATWSGSKLNFRPGMVINIQTSYFTNVATGASVMPDDDTIPQSNEGMLVMALAYTPKSPTSILMVEGMGNFSSNNAAANIIAALFNSTASSAIVTASNFGSSTAWIHQMSMLADVTTGNTQPVTFTIRLGTPGGSVIAMNAYNGATRLYGGSLKSWLRVTEIAQ